MINEKYNLEIKLRIQDVEKDVWNNLAEKLDNPFYEWEWLLNLEASKSVSQKTGWQPLYFLLYLDEELHEDHYLSRILEIQLTENLYLKKLMLLE